MFRAALLVLVTAVAVQAGTAEKEKTPADFLAIAKNPAKGSIARNEAIGRLGSLTEADVVRDLRVVDELINILKVPTGGKPTDMFVRAEAVKALGQLQKNADPRAKDRYIPVMAAILKDPKESKDNVNLQRVIAQNFRDTLNRDGLQDKDAYKALLDLAKTKTTPGAVRKPAIEAVGAFGSIDGLDVLITLLSAPEAEVREWAAGSLYTLMGQLDQAAQVGLPAINKLIEMLNDKNLPEELRVNVMKVLAALIREKNNSAKTAFEVIANIVSKEQNDRLVKGGIEALGIIGSAEAVKPLVAAYKDYVAGGGSVADKSKDVEIRQTVIESTIPILANQSTLAQPEASAVSEITKDLLVKALDDDPAANIKRSAIIAMRYLYPPTFQAAKKEGIDALEFHLRQPATTEDVKREIVETLTVLTGHDFGLDVKRWSKTLFPNRAGQ